MNILIVVMLGIIILCLINSAWIAALKLPGWELSVVVNVIHHTYLNFLKAAQNRKNILKKYQEKIIIDGPVVVLSIPGGMQW